MVSFLTPFWRAVKLGIILYKKYLRKFSLRDATMNRKIVGTFLKIAYCLGIVVLTVLMSFRDSKANLKREVVIEAGSPIRVEDFFNVTPDDAEFITDVSSINTNIPAVYNLKIHYDLIFAGIVSIKIEDTTGPVGSGLARRMFSYESLPEAKDLVKDVNDISGVSSVEYESVPDISTGGVIRTPIKLTDNYGNSSVVSAQLVVIVDSTPPKIHGANNIEIVQGDTPDLSNGIYATDNYSKDIPVRINASGFNKDVPGTYEITYTAQDDAGNKSSEVAVVTVNKKTAAKKKKTKKKAKKTTKKTKVTKASSYYSKRADQMANALIKKLKRGSDVETARAIFNWVHKNVHYVYSSSRLSGKRAAYEGLTKHRGNCRVIAYTCQLLLNKAGIRNMIVYRYPLVTKDKSIPQTMHLWNLVYMDGGWYHCDATPYISHPGVYFKLTDKQLDKYHKFNKKKYPARATS